MQRANQTNYFPEFPGKSPVYFKKTRSKWKFLCSPGLFEISRNSVEFPRNFQEISRKSPRKFLEFPGIFKHSFFKYFRYFLDNYKQQYIQEPQ